MGAIAYELQRIPKALFRVQQDGLAVEEGSVPKLPQVGRKMKVIALHHHSYSAQPCSNFPRSSQHIPRLRWTCAKPGIMSRTAWYWAMASSNFP